MVSQHVNVCITWRRMNATQCVQHPCKPRLQVMQHASQCHGQHHTDGQPTNNINRSFLALQRVQPCRASTLQQGQNPPGQMSLRPATHTEYQKCWPYTKTPVADVRAAGPVLQIINSALPRATRETPSRWLPHLRR